MKLRIGIIATIFVMTLNAAAQRYNRSATYGGAIPQGTQLQIRMIDALSSATATPGQTFRASLAQSVIANGRTLYPRGADVTGQVIDSKSSGRLSAPGELELALTQITVNGVSYPIAVEPIRMKGESHAKSNVTKIGGGAAAGAVIGAIAGGGKGAAIGAGVGAAGGTAVAAATGKKESTVESEAVLGFVTSVPPRAAGQPVMNAAERDRARRDQRGESYADSRRGRDRDGDEDRDEDDDRGTRRNSDPVFSRRDRDYIRSCMSGNYGNLPPGLAKRGGNLPPGLEKQVERNGQLPPGLQKRVQPLPDACISRLPRLPADWARVILGHRIILLDPRQRIADLFSLDGDD